MISPPNYTEKSIVDKAHDIDVMFGGFISEKLLHAAINLKFIQIPWAGIDNLDFRLLKKYNITLCNSHSNAFVVAEHAVALMFDAAKKISYHDRLLRKGEWNRLKPDHKNEISPFSNIITKSNVGIIGFGAVGGKIYHLLSGFSCSFYIFTKDITLSNNCFENLNFFSTTELSEHLPELDFIFIAVPLTPETKGLVNRAFFEAMKQSAILINISRGDVIIEKDLFNALKQNEIGFAAIDTWYNYPTNESPITFPSKKFEFHSLNNLVLSPHRAGYVEGILPHLDDAIENLNRFAKGESLMNIVSLDNNY